MEMADKVKEMGCVDVLLNISKSEFGVADAFVIKKTKLIYRPDRYSLMCKDVNLATRIV